MGLLSGAFNAMLSIHSRTGKLVRLASPNIEKDIKFTPSNYFRKLEGPSETTIQGKEWIIGKSNLDLSTFGIIKRGDRLVDTELGSMVIDEVIPMYDLGGSIMGFRIRTED